jgi:hypothetical protein
VDRRDFIGFFLLGGIFGLLARRAAKPFINNGEVPARFWRPL